MADEAIRGGRQLAEFLQQLPAKVEKNIMRAALRAGANEIRKEARERVPVDSGMLYRSLKVSTNSKRGRVTARLKVGGRLAPHAYLVEFGTRPHKITARNGGGLTVGGNVVREVDHPGARPHPFMRPALDARSSQAVAAVAAKVRERLTLAGINAPAPEDP